MKEKNPMSKPNNENNKEDKKNLSRSSEQTPQPPRTGQDDKKHYPNEIYEEILPPQPRLN